MLAGIRAVIFDLDGTLLDRHRSFELFVRDQWSRFADAVHPVSQDIYAQTLIELDREGYGPRGGLFIGTVEKFGLAAALADTLRNDFRAEFARTCVLFPDALATLSSLRAAVSSSDSSRTARYGCSLGSWSVCRSFPSSIRC